MDKIFDPSLPVQTRDGKPARIVCTDRLCNGGHRLVVLIQHKGGSEHVESRSITGLVLEGHLAPLDLINIPTKLVRWFNIYEIGSHRQFLGPYLTESDAYANVTSGEHYTASKPIEWEE
jgi:hypothetical protein